jgi:hypothetical protein
VEGDRDRLEGVVSETEEELTAEDVGAGPNNLSKRLGRSSTTIIEVSSSKRGGEKGRLIFIDVGDDGERGEIGEMGSKASGVLEPTESCNDILFVFEIIPCS